MNNIFDVIDYKFFQVFSGENRKIHAEIIMVISDYFKYNNTGNIEKEDLVNHLTEYINHRAFDYFLDDEGNDISKSSSREKALNKLNLFKRNGWLIEEKIENYVDIIQFDDNALIILKALEDISNNSAPKEYTGYIYVIDSLLRTFDYNQGVSLLERIYDNTETLMNRLRGLNSSIKKYLTRLLNEDSEDANKLLQMLLNEYQDNIINKAFSNLKLNDNPSKFKNQILSKLNEIGSNEGMKQLVQNYKTTKSSTMDDQEIEEVIYKQIDYVYGIIEGLQKNILTIDDKNSKYLNSSKSKLSFILSDSFDVEGKIDNILKLMKHQKKDEFYEDAFGLYKMGILDHESLYKPRVYKEPIITVKLQEKPNVDQKFVDRVNERLFKENIFSIQKINRYVGTLLEKQTVIKSSDLIFETSDDITRLILIQLYSHHDQMCYQTEALDSIVTTRDIEYKDFKIIKRGKEYVK